MCTLTSDESNTNLSGDLLHFMSSAILPRFSKLGSSASDWLSEMVLKTCTSLREILDTRKQQSVHQSPFRNLSQDELARDTQPSLLDSREYIRDALANHVHESVLTPFRPNHRRRGTIEDFVFKWDLFRRGL